MSSIRNNPLRRNRRRPGKTIIGKAATMKLEKSFPTNGKYIRCNEKKRRIFMCAPTFSEILYPRVDAAPTISEILSSRIYTLQSIKQRIKRVFDERELSTSAVDRAPNCFIAAEILELIFLYLPLDDRKNVRLVCKLWNQNCTSTVITKKEKLVFRAHCSVSDITNVLLESSFIRMNLEFHNEHINDIPTDAWKIAGHKVNEVSIYWTSRLQDKTLRDIILHCENLTSIKMWKSWEEDTSSNLLDFFINQSIERTRVHTFSTSCKLPNSSISSDTTKKIFLIFPHIKHFCVRNYVTPKIKSSNDSIILHSPTQLESLAYSSKLSDDCWQTKPVIPVWETRLTKIQITLTDSINESRMFHFFTVQKELKTIILRLSSFRDEELTKKLIFHILENCSKLRNFRFVSSQIIKLNGEESARFFALISNLQCLSTVGTMSFEMSAMPPRDLALNILSLKRNIRNIEEPDLFYLLKYSAQVRCLFLNNHNISDAILLEIFKNMTNLETLVLDFMNKCTTDGFTGQYPMRRLRKLKHLELKRFTKKKFNIVEFARELQFLPLKHLHLSTDLSSADILSITSNTPMLESLIFDYPWPRRLCSVETTVEFCKCLKKLKYLHVELDLKEHNLGTGTSIKPIFEACPSLRYVRVDSNYSVIRKVYSFNPFTNEVLFNSSDDLFFYPGRIRIKEIKF